MISLEDKLDALTIDAKAVPSPQKPTLLIIPTEVQLQIVGSLEMKETQRLRRVCTTFKALIDKHKAMLAKPVYDREIARLQRFVDHHNYHNLPLLKAMQRWTSHKGHWLNSKSRFASGQTFYSHLIINCQFPGRLAFHMEEYTFFMHSLFVLHLFKHKGIKNLQGQQYIESLDAFLALFRASGQASLGEDLLTECYQAISKDPKAMDGELHKKEDNICDEVAGYLLTILCVEEEVVAGPCRDGAKLYAALGIADIGMLGAFAYYAIDKWTLDQVMCATKSKIKVADPLLKAAIVQGLFIH